MTNLQLLRILHGIIVISKCLRRPGLSSEKFRILQLLIESWFSVLRRRLGNFTTAFNSIIAIPKLHKKLAVRAIFKKTVISEIPHFTIFSRILAFNPYKRLGTFEAVYYTMESLLRQSFSERLQLGLSSEKLVISEISHFTNFNRNLVYYP